MRRVTGMTIFMALALLIVATMAVPVTGQDPGADAAGAVEATSQEAEEAPPDAALAAFGRGVYRVYCVSCHGAAAEGDGRLAEYLTIKPADLTTIEQRNEGTFPRERIHQIIDGRQEVRGHDGGEMPVWGDAFLKVDALEAESPEVREAEVGKKIDSLIHYLRSIQK